MSALTIFLDRMMSLARSNRNGEQCVIGAGSAGAYECKITNFPPTSACAIVCFKQPDGTWQAANYGASSEQTAILAVLNP